VNRAPHETLLLEMSEQSYHLWRHSPVTAAYLKYLADQVEAFRTAAADMLEEGRLGTGSDVLRGRILTLRELHTLSLEDIHEFYRQPEGNGDENGSAETS
jgi:hypothetical protein